jgi:Protein of unknown function (DUF3768)
MTTFETPETWTIVTLNDRLRSRPGSGWVLTAAVRSRGTHFVNLAINAVRYFDAFTPGDKPHGERDFGAFEVCGERLFWKIDYYDLEFENGSEDPANPAITRRILTIMMASDY